MLTLLQVPPHTHVTHDTPHLHSPPLTYTDAHTLIPSHIYSTLLYSLTMTHNHTHIDAYSLIHAKTHTLTHILTYSFSEYDPQGRALLFRRMEWRRLLTVSRKI